MIEVDISHIWTGVSLPELLAVEKEIASSHEMLTERTGPGASMLGWLDLPGEEELCKIQKTAEKIRSQCEVCVILGTGGGVLGARAAMEFLPEKADGLQLYFAGDSLSTRRWNELTRLLEGRDFSAVAISKAGDTLETAIAFRGLRWILERRYGTEEAARRIYAVTVQGSSLHTMAEENNWTHLEFPCDVSEPFSVLTAAGLLPMALAGLDISAVVQGGKEAMECGNLRSFENPLWLYAGVRNALYRKGKGLELFGSFSPEFCGFGKWWQQLFADAEGRDGKGIFPISVEYPRNLHGLGQRIREGKADVFQTLLHFDGEAAPYTIVSDIRDLDGLNVLSGRQLDEIEDKAFQDTVQSHMDSGVPVITMDCGIPDEKKLGECFRFLELACAISAYILGVNPWEGAEPETNVMECEENRK